MILLFAAHLVGNAALLWLGYYWLGVGESDTGHLLWSASLVLFLIIGAAWLHGTALAHFSGLGVLKAAGRSARNILPLLALTLLAIAVYGGLIWIGHSYGKTAYVIGSYSTMQLKRPVPPTAVARVFSAILWLFRWLIVPALLLPLAASISVYGWRGWSPRSLRHNRKVLYWIEVCALLWGALWLPFKLFFWVPHVGSFNGEMASFIVRNGGGYLLFVVALLALEFFTSSGKPPVTQVSTAVLP